MFFFTLISSNPDTKEIHFLPSFSLRIGPSVCESEWKARWAMGSSFLRVGRLPNSGWFGGWGGGESLQASFFLNNKHDTITRMKRISVSILTVVVLITDCRSVLKTTKPKPVLTPCEKTGRWSFYSSVTNEKLFDLTH